MKINVVNTQNVVTEEIELSDYVFNVTPRKDILQRVVLWQLAKRRSGSHNVKGKSDVHGTTKKMYKQKGTGGARHGSKKAAQFRGAGVVFGPVNRDHGYNLPKKVKKLALRMALSAKVSENMLVVVDDFVGNEYSKTSDVVKRYGKCEKILFVDCDKNAEVYRGIANAVNYDYIPQIGLNVYDILRKDKIVATKDAVKLIEERLS